jgi:predicted RND superfamily exporter protein
MNIVVSPKLLRLFLHVLQARYWVAGIYLVLALAGIYGASRIPTDPAIERLVVAGDPVAQATLEFERVFPEGEQALLMLEAPDPLSQATLQGAEQLERGLGKIPKVEAHSLLTLFRRADAAADISTDTYVRHRHVAFPSSRAFGRALLRNRSRPAGQFPGRA